MPIGWFVDGAYLSRCHSNLDFVKLRERLEAELGDTVDEGYYFTADTDPPKQQGFANFLSNQPPIGPGLRPKIYWLTTKQLNWPPHLGGQPVVHPTIPNTVYQLTQQKAVDVGLAFHMVRSFYKRKWSKLVLCAGDGDFHEPAQSLVEGEGVDLFIVGKQGTISPNLTSHAKAVFHIDQEPWRTDVTR